MILRSQGLLRSGVLLGLATAGVPTQADTVQAGASGPALERIVVTAQRIDVARIGGSVAFLDAVQLE